MSCAFLPGFRKLCPFLAIDFRFPWGLSPHAVAVALLLIGSLALPLSAQAEETAPTASSRSETHLALGPLVAAIQYDSQWDSEIGAELHLAHVRDSDLLSVFGTSIGVASFGKGDMVQLSLDFYAGTQALTKVPIGLSLGPVLEAFPNGRPQIGGRVAVWVYHGVMPYFSVAWLRGRSASSHPSLEIGLKIPFSIWGW